MARRLLFAAAALVGALLLAEGALSLLAGRSLRQLVGAGVAAGAGAEADGLPLTGPTRPGDTARQAAAAAVPGAHRVHPDPRVGYTLKVESQQPSLEATVTTDALGMRRRPGAPPAPDALRVIVLGDSVAFGLGLGDDQTVASQLELLLAAARGPAARPVAAFTVATPGWNPRNAISFLLDHFDAIDPDLVVFMPVANDLANTWAVTEAGHLRENFDILTPHVWLPMHIEGGLERLFLLAEKSRAGDTPRITLAETGPAVIESDLTPESSRRYDDIAARLLQLEARLRRKTPPGQLMVAAGVSPVTTLVLERLQRAGATLPVVPLLSEYLPEDTLGDNPHPNAATARVLAIWIAEALLREGLVEGGAGAPLPEVTGSIASRHLAPRGADALRAEASAHRQQSLEALKPEIDGATGRGLRQICSGVSAELRMGPELLAVLPRAGSRLQVTLTPLAERPDLYPLTVQVEIDGQGVGSIVLEAQGAGADAGAGAAPAPVTASFAIPPAASGANGSSSVPFEVGLRAPDWVVVSERDRSLLASCRFDALRLVDE